MRGLSKGEQAMLDALKGSCGRAVAYNDLHAFVRASTTPVGKPDRPVALRIARIRKSLDRGSIHNVAGRGYVYFAEKNDQ